MPGNKMLCAGFLGAASSEKAVSMGKSGLFDASLPLENEGFETWCGFTRGLRVCVFGVVEQGARTFLDRHCFPRMRTQIAAYAAVGGAGFGAVSGVVAGVERG